MNPMQCWNLKIMSKRLLELLIWGFRVYAGVEQSGIFLELYAPSNGA